MLTPRPGPSPRPQTRSRTTTHAGGKLATLGLSVPTGTVTVMFWGPVPALAVILAVTLACWPLWWRPAPHRRQRPAAPRRSPVAPPMLAPRATGSS